MCWTTEKIKHISPKLAKKDIETIKCVIKENDDGSFKSIFYTFTFIKNKTNECDILIKQHTKDNPSDINNYKKYMCIENGFHSLDPNKVTVEKGNLLNNGIEIIFVTSALKTRLEYAKLFGKFILVSCTIPKGSIYFENELGEIVSNKIIIRDEIEMEFKDVDDKIIHYCFDINTGKKEKNNETTKKRWIRSNFDTKITTSITTLKMS